MELESVIQLPEGKTWETVIISVVVIGSDDGSNQS